MRIIKDFEEAQALLRRSPFEPDEIPINTKKRIKDVFGKELTPEEAVRRIIADVRNKGDTALFDYTERIDGASLSSLEVSREEIEEAYGKVDSELISALNTAAQRVLSFHQLQMRHCVKAFTEGGLGQIVRPLEKVGVYVPGGTACYPSTVLMTAIPAKVAGVNEVIVATPPKRDGEIPAPTLVAAGIAKVDR
ncbi:MAG: histidinol dehydrogenase, partial [Dehalococcoidia bacterium]